MAKKIFRFTHTIGENYSQILPPSSEISVGKSFKNTVIEASLSYLPERHILFKKSGKEISLFILKGMSGELSNDGLTISIDNLISTGQLAKRGNGFVLKVPYEASGYLVFGKNRLEFGFHEDKKKIKEKIKIDRSSMRRPLIDKGDNLIIFLIFSLIVHYSLVQYAKSIKITETKIGDIAKVPQRLAKFILEPIPKKEQPVIPKKEKEEEKKESDKKDDKSKESKETSEKAEEKEEEKKSKSENEPVISEKRQNIREKIGNNALLGVFTSKEIEQKSDEIFSQIDSFLVDVADVKAGKDGAAVGAGDDALTRGEITSFDKISEGFGDFSKDGGKAVEYQKVVKREAGEKIKLAEKETIKLETASKESTRPEAEKVRTRKKSSIDKVVQTYIGGLKFLYNRELRKDNSLRGKLVVKFTISPEGKVTLAELVETTFENNELVQEMLKRIEKWKFPAEDVEDTTVVYPFVFMPVG